MADFKPYREKPLPLQDQAFCQASGRISRPFGSVLSSRIPGSPGDLQVKTAGVGIAVDNFSGKIQAGNQLGLHGFRVNFRNLDTAGGNNGFRHRAFSSNIQGKVFDVIGTVLIYISLALTVISLIDYLAKNKDVLKEQN